MANLLKTFQTFGGILVICPCCNELLRVSDLSFRYTGEFEPTVLDELRQAEGRLTSRQRALNTDRETFEAKVGSLRAAATQRGQAKMRDLIRTIDPLTSKLEYDPKDIKVISHPVDLIVFDGLNSSDGHIKNIIFIARSGAAPTQETRRSLVDALKSGRFLWETVRVGIDGAVTVRH